MFDLGTAIQQAWPTVLQSLKADPDKLEQRLARIRTGVVTRPIRPWCLAIRANDTRLPKDAMYRVHGVNAKNVLEVPLLNHDSAGLEITADLLRALNHPIRLPSPGIDVQDAAKLTGRTRAAFTTARLSGQFRTHHHPGLSGKHGP